MMHISNLRHHPHHLAQLAHWHFAEWAYLQPQLSLTTLQQDMQAYIQPEFLPSMFIMLDQQQLVGSSSIVAHDLPSRPQLGPWLANVYVQAGYRGQGIGRQLVIHAMQQARQAGITQLYLFTSDQQEFYASLGWQPVDQELIGGIAHTIMALDLSHNGS